MEIVLGYMQFQPKHYNHSCWGVDGVYITSDNHVVVSNSIKWDIEIGNHPNDFESSSKHEILYENKSMSYEDLMLVDNAISVCNIFTECYAILLSNNTVIYIVYYIDKDLVRNIMKDMQNIPIHYMDKAANMVLYYSSTTLYCIDINEKFEPKKIYDNVIGYMSGENIVLILYNNGKIGLVCARTLYSLDAMNKLNPIDSNDILNGVNSDKIVCISIQFNNIYIIVGTTLYYFTSDKINRFYAKIKDFRNIVSITFKNTIGLCLLDDNRLFIETTDKSEIIMDVNNFLIIDNYLVFFHLNRTLSVVKYNTQKIACYYSFSKDESLLVDLSNPTNFDMLDNILKILMYDKDKGTDHLIYINKYNNVEILDIKKSELVSLSTFLSVESDITTLPLIQYSGENYI